MLPNATPLELAWTLQALLGLVFAVRGLGTAWADRRAVRTLAAQQTTLSAPRRIPAADVARRVLVANGYLREELIRLLILSVFVFVGVRFDLLPPNPAATDNWTTITGLLFLGAGAALTVASIAARRDRARFDRLGAPIDRPARSRWPPRAA